MKIAIIGAGHIGSAIVTCLAQGHLYNEKDIIVSNPNIDKLERLQEHFPAIHITTDNQQAISEMKYCPLYVSRVHKSSYLSCPEYVSPTWLI